MKETSLTKKVKVRNELGLHTRPATMIVQLIQHVKSDVFFTYKKETVDAKSILNLLILAAQKNAEISIMARGIDAKETIENLVEVFENNFGEN